MEFWERENTAVVSLLLFIDTSHDFPTTESSHDVKIWYPLTDSDSSEFNDSQRKGFKEQEQNIERAIVLLKAPDVDVWKYFIALLHP
jgi:hypothetical protein